MVFIVAQRRTFVGIDLWKTSVRSIVFTCNVCVVRFFIHVDLYFIDFALFILFTRFGGRLVNVQVLVYIATCRLTILRSAFLGLVYCGEKKAVRWFQV